jgi:hypothetical protein
MKERLVWASVLIVIILTTGCGRGGEGHPSSANRPQSQAPSSNQPVPEETPPSTPEPTPTPSTQVQSYAISISGSQLVSQRIETGSILVLSLKPTPNANSDYGCVSFEVSIGGSNFQTGILRVEGIETGNCPQSPTTFEMDYSQLLSAGANTLDISIRVERIDRSCYMLGLRCPSWPPQATDAIQGELTLETNQPN